MGKFSIAYYFYSWTFIKTSGKKFFNTVCKIFIALRKTAVCDSFTKFFDIPNEMSIAASNCCLRRGKRMSADRSRGVSLRSLKRRISISNRRTLVRKRKPASLKRKTRYASIPRNALPRTCSFTEFMTTPPKISGIVIHADSGTENMRGCRTICVIPCVGEERACIHFFSHCASTCKFQLSSYYLEFFSCPLLRFTYFSDVALSVFRATIGWKQ